MSKSIMKPKKETKINEKKSVSKVVSKKKNEIEEEAEAMKKRTDELMEKEHNRLLERMKDLINELERLKLENEKLRRQQEQKMGVTAETVDKMRKDLDHAKATNNFLLRLIEDRKDQVSQLETQTFEMNIRLESTTKKLNDIKRINESRKTEIDELSKDRLRVEKLSEENRMLRRFLATNFIDSKTGKPLVDTYKEKRRDLQKKKVTIRGTLKSKGLETVNKRMSKSVEDLRTLEGYYDARSAGSDVKDRKINYGDYADILKRRRDLMKKKSKQ